MDQNSCAKTKVSLHLWFSPLLHEAGQSCKTLIQPGVNTWMGGRTQFNLFPSLHSLCLLEFYPAFISEACSSGRVMLLAKIKPKGCVRAVCWPFLLSGGVRAQKAKSSAGLVEG